MINLSQPWENMNLIQEKCGIVGTATVTAFFGNHLAAGSICLFDLA